MKQKICTFFGVKIFLNTKLIVVMNYTYIADFYLYFSSYTTWRFFDNILLLAALFTISSLPDASSPFMKNENQACRRNIRKYRHGCARDGRHGTFFQLPVFVNPRLMFSSARDDTRNSHVECVASRDVIMG